MKSQFELSLVTVKEGSFLFIIGLTVIGMYFVAKYVVEGWLQYIAFFLVIAGLGFLFAHLFNKWQDFIVKRSSKPSRKAGEVENETC